MHRDNRGSDICDEGVLLVWKLDACSSTERGGLCTAERLFKWLFLYSADGMRWNVLSMI